jgi:hypothetical protein
MSKGNTLVELAYYSLSKKDFLNLSRTKTHSIEKAVFDDIQKELRKNHKPFSKWFPTTYETTMILYQIYLYSNFITSIDYKKKTINDFWKSFMLNMKIKRFMDPIYEIENMNKKLNPGDRSSSYSKSTNEKEKAIDFPNNMWSKKDWMIYKTFYLLVQSIYDRNLYKKELERFNDLMEKNKKHTKETNFISDEDMNFLKRVNFHQKTNNKMMPFQIYFILNKSFYNRRIFIKHGYEFNNFSRTIHVIPKTLKQNIPKQDIAKIIKSMNLYFTYIRKFEIKNKLSNNVSLWKQFVEDASLTDFIQPEEENILRYILNNNLKLNLISDQAYESSKSGTSNDSLSNYNDSSGSNGDEARLERREFIEHNRRLDNRQLARRDAEIYWSDFPIHTWSKYHWILFHCFMLMIRNIQQDKKDYIDYLNQFMDSEYYIPKSKENKIIEKYEKLKKMDMVNNKNLLKELHRFLNEYFIQQAFEDAGY